MKVFRKSLALLLVVCIACTIFPHTYAATQAEIDAATQKRNELQQQLVEINKKLANIKDEVSKAQAKTDTYADRVGIVQQQINTIKQSIDLKTQQLTLKQQELDLKQEQQQQTYELFKERLRAMYMSSSNTSTLSILLGSASFADFLINAHNVSVISETDKQTIEQLKQEEEEIVTAEDAIQTELDSLESDKASLDGKYSELAALYQEANGQLSDAQARQDATQEDYDQILDNINKANAELDALTQGSSDTYYGTGVWGWPVPGYSYISSGFGWRTLYGKPNWHGGIDIAGSGIYGASIVASDSGVVKYAIYGSTGYGYYVIIDHGQNNWTVYGHMSSILVSAGQSVTRGETIGRVGSTGNSTGPHLHFEIRLNGTKVDPRLYL